MSLILKLFTLGQTELLNGRASLASMKPYVLFNINYTQGLPWGPKKKKKPTHKS